MAVVDVLVPQMGEGLQEVRLVTRQKQPGDPIKRDELLYTMETDKAIMEVESPYEGVLQEWLAEEDAVLPIGAPIARIATGPEAGTGQTARPVSGSEPVAASGAAVRDGDGPQIPPRTRAYGREHGLSDEQLRQIPAPTGKLMPADVEAFLAGREAGQDDTPYTERPLSSQQRLLVSRIKRSAQLVVPATMRRPLVWGAFHRYVETLRAHGDEPRPTDFQVFAWCVAQAVRSHSKFRSTLVGDAIVREYGHLNLGIAVARPDGNLATAVVPAADTLTGQAFVRRAQERIQAARAGEDQADEATQLLLTYMGPYDIVDGVPLLVAPAVGVLFLGSTFEQQGEPMVNLSLTIDHRLINGVEGAEFLRTVAETAARVQDLYDKAP